MTNEYVNKINETDKSYFAGLLDGEGCIFIDKDKRKGIYYNLAVSFHITYAPVLYEMKRLFGGYVREVNMEKAKNCQSVKSTIAFNTEDWKQSYYFCIHGKEAWMFLKIIEPFCREKKDQVRIGIEFFQGYKSGSQLERCEYYYKKLQELKKPSEKIDNTLLLEFNDSQKTFSVYLEK